MANEGSDFALLTNYGGSRGRCGTPALEKASVRESQLAKVGRFSGRKSLPKDHLGFLRRGNRASRAWRSRSISKVDIYLSGLI